MAVSGPTPGIVWSRCALSDRAASIFSFLMRPMISKHSEHMPLNRQAIVMARLGVPIERSVLADWMGRTGALIAPVVDRMAVLLKSGSSRLYVDETTAPVLDPGRGRTKTGYL